MRKHKETTGELGRLLRAGRGHRTIVEWGQLLQINKNTVGAYEHEKSLPDVEFLARFAEETGCDFLSLLIARLAASADTAAKRAGLSLDVLRRQAANEEGTISVPWLSATALSSCVGPVQEIRMPRDWLKTNGVSKPEYAAFFTVADDSMSPCLKRGDMVLCDRALTAPADGVFVVSIEDGICCKRLQRLPGKVRVGSDNPRYETFHLSMHSITAKLTVIGRVTQAWAGKRL